ncbi:hypothetical protein NHX12_023610, partial [Muraenolepis orangiensis]
MNTAGGVCLSVLSSFLAGALATSALALVHLSAPATANSGAEGSLSSSGAASSGAMLQPGGRLAVRLLLPAGALPPPATWLLLVPGEPQPYQETLELRLVEVLLINNQNSSQFTCGVLCRWLEECLLGGGRHGGESHEDRGDDRCSVTQTGCVCPNHNMAAVPPAVSLLTATPHDDTTRDCSPGHDTCCVTDQNSNMVNAIEPRDVGQAPHEICKDEFLLSMEWKRASAGETVYSKCLTNATEHLAKGKRTLAGEGMSQIVRSLLELLQRRSFHSGDLLFSTHILRNVTDTFKRATYIPAPDDVQVSPGAALLMRILEDFIHLIGEAQKPFQSVLVVTNNLMITIQREPVSAVSSDINFPLKGRRGIKDWARTAEDKLYIPKE